MHIITTLDQGGAETMLVRLLQGIDRENFLSSVVSLTTQGTLGDIVEATDIPVTTIGMKGLASVPGSILRLCNALRAYKPDVVHTWLYHSDLLGLLAARLVTNASVVWNVRCARLEPGDVSHPTRWLIKGLSMFSSNPDMVLFNSVAGQRAHQSIGYRTNNCLVIPNGFDLEILRPDERLRSQFRAEINVEKDTFLIGMVARYHKVKDQSTFLAAAARLKDMEHSIRFVLVGYKITWSNKSLVADIDRYGLRDRIVLLGLRSDMPRVMAGLDCLVSTSTSEGFPNVIGEAMACGVPCVATDVGDTRNIIGDTGNIVSVGDVEGLIEGMKHNMTAGVDEKEKRSARCRKRIKEHFELSSIVTRYADVYRKLGERHKQH